jgi:CheY-like chemotaxis protein
MEKLKTVYLVDDDDDDRMLIREALQSVIESVTIIEIENGEALIKVFEKPCDGNDPALILMDMNMPRLSGLETLAVIKSNPVSIHIPVVMISTTTDQQLVLRAYEQGINAFITKPVSVLELEQMAQDINICFLHHYHNASSNPIFSKKLKGRSILIIDDNEDHWQLIKQGLNSTLPDVNIIRTADKENTVDFLNIRVDVVWPSMPELIILDLYLPTKQDGLELLGWIRQFFALHKMPPATVIVFSSSGQQQDIKESYAVGANAYMVKSEDLTKSASNFKDLCHFWWNTVTLPKRNL